MFFSNVLKKKIDPDDQVMNLFIDHLLPQLIIHYASQSAKGGACATLDAKIRSEFEKDADQSMLSYQLNGLFPTLHLVKIVQAERLGELGKEPLSDRERQVYMLSYLMHDVDKIRCLCELKTTQREDIEAVKQALKEELQKCQVEAFFPDFAQYLEDITFLAVNMQRKWGVHLTTFGWQLQLKRISLLHQLCTYSDLIAYELPCPSATISDNMQALRSILSQLSSHQLEFCYHQLREVHGLLTNIANSAIGQLVAPETQEGIWPYLFFSDGVVYIKRQVLKIALVREQVAEAVQNRLQGICANAIRNRAPGLKFSIQGVAKFPGYYFEFLSLEEFTDLLVRYTISSTQTDITATPIAKLHQMQATGEISDSLSIDFEPDYRIGMISRLLSIVFVTVLGMLDKKRWPLQEMMERLVIEELGLTPYWSQAQTIPTKSGVEYRWFWLAGRYYRDHLGCNEEDLRMTFTAIMELLISRVGDELRRRMSHQYLEYLTHYLDATLELSEGLGAKETFSDFYGEMEQYVAVQSKKHSLVCTLCSSAYPTEEQSDRVVLFQPWIYKNKLSLYAGKNAGGICAVCLLELMLRQILLKGQLPLTSSKFDVLKTKYIAIYPNNFFTAETGAMVQGMLNQLRDINFLWIRQQLQGRGIAVEEVLKLEAFQVSDDETLVPEPEEIFEDGNNEEEQPGKVTDHSYIKYDYPKDSYPGMYIFGMRASRQDTDASSWAMPAFLALALPLVTGAKVVISEMQLPLFSSGRDFHEAVLFDAPHPYLDVLLGEKRIRVNEVLTKLCFLTDVYQLNIAAFAKNGRPEWRYLNQIISDIMMDPLFVFAYLRKQHRGASLYAGDTAQCLRIYRELSKLKKEDDWSKIQQCVDLYTKFYRGGYEAYSILRPVDIVAKAIIKSSPDTEVEDLLWHIRAELKNWLDRVRTGQARGWAVIPKRETYSVQASLIKDFVDYFYGEVFLRYCQGERGELRSRLNYFKDGCEAYYIEQRQSQRIQEKEQEQMLEIIP